MPAKPKVIFVGDSTVKNGAGDGGRGQWGWGDRIGRFFDPERIEVINRAQGGRSSRTFISEGRWDAVLETLEKGDFVLIRFGHNDQKQKGPGIGPWGNYTESLKTFIAEARLRGMVPVLATPVRRRKLEEGRVTNTHGEYPEAMRRLAAEEKVPLIDLHMTTKTLYESLEKNLGENGSAIAFVHYPAGTFPGQNEELKDDSHFNSYGAYEAARLVVEGIRQIKPDEILAFLRPETEPFDPAKPDEPGGFSLPLSPFAGIEKPAGT